MTPTILIVDDELFMLRLIETSLKKGGFSVLSCRSGADALAAALLHQPQLIIMDLMMPGVDGLTALRQIKATESLRAIPVIMLTAKGSEVTQVEAAQSGADVFLTKPFSPSQLLAHARKLLENELTPG